MISHDYSYINIGVLEILSRIKYARFETLRVFNKETTHSHTLPISGGRRGKGGGLCAIRGGALDWRTSIPHDDANFYALECSNKKSLPTRVRVHPHLQSWVEV
jgi:hypothetical protein